MFGDRIARDLRSFRRYSFSRVVWELFLVGLAVAAVFYTGTFFGMSLGEIPPVAGAVIVGGLVVSKIGLAVSVAIYFEYLVSGTQDEASIDELFRGKVIPCFNWAFGGIVVPFFAMGNFALISSISDALFERYGNTLSVVRPDLAVDAGFLVVLAIFLFFLRRDAKRSA